MKTIQISEETRIPGTNLILEANDRIFFKEEININSILEEFYSIMKGTLGDQVDENQFKELSDFIHKLPINIDQNEILLNGEGKFTSLMIKKENFYWDVLYTPSDGLKSYFVSLPYITTGFVPIKREYSNIIEAIKEINSLGSLGSSIFNKVRDIVSHSSYSLGSSKFPFNVYRYAYLCLKKKTPENLLKEFDSDPSGKKWARFIVKNFILNEHMDQKEVLQKRNALVKKYISPIESLIFGKGKGVTAKFISRIDSSINVINKSPKSNKVYSTDPLESKALKSFAKKLSATPLDIVSDLEDYMKDTKNRVRRQRSISEAVYEYLAEFVDYVYEEDLMDYYDPYYGFPGKTLYFEIIQPIEIKVFGEATY